jgi:hypothetical protein
MGKSNYLPASSKGTAPPATFPSQSALNEQPIGCTCGAGGPSKNNEGQGLLDGAVP